MVDPYEIADEFAKEFAKFEYALKRGGFLLAKAKDARADRVGLAEALGATFFEYIETKNIAPTILSHSPRKLMQDGLKWVPENPAPITTVAELMEKGVCRIRSSYLHGEKFIGGPYNAQLGRDAKLVAEALAVLRAARDRVPSVSALL